MVVRCWKCGRSYQVPEHLEGKKTRCKGCQSVIVLSSKTSRAAALLRGPSGEGRRPPIASERDPGRTAPPLDLPGAGTPDPEPPIEGSGPDDLKGLNRKAFLFIAIGIVIYMITFPIAMKLSANFQGLFGTMSVQQKSEFLVKCISRSAWMFCVAFYDRASPGTQMVVLSGWILSLAFLLKGLRWSFEAKGSSTWWTVLTCVLAALLSPFLALILAAIAPNRRKGSRADGA